jgi:hypothetical protein
MEVDREDASPKFGEEHSSGEFLPWPTGAPSLISGKEIIHISPKGNHIKSLEESLQTSEAARPLLAIGPRWRWTTKWVLTIWVPMKGWTMKTRVMA